MVGIEAITSNNQDGEFDAIVSSITNNLGIDAISLAKKNWIITDLNGRSDNSDISSGILINIGDVPEATANETLKKFRQFLESNGHYNALHEIPIIQNLNTSYFLLDSAYVSDNQQQLADLFASKKDELNNKIIPQEARDSYMSAAEEKLSNFIYERITNNPSDPFAESTDIGILKKLSDILDAKSYYDTSSARISIPFSSSEQAEKFRDTLRQAAESEADELAPKLEEVKTTKLQSGRPIYWVSFLAQPLVTERGDTTALFSTLNKNKQLLRDALPGKHEAYTTVQEEEQKREIEENKIADQYIEKAKKFFGKDFTIEKLGRNLQIIANAGVDVEVSRQKLLEIRKKTGIPAEEINFITNGFQSDRVVAKINIDRLKEYDKRNSIRASKGGKGSSKSEAVDFFQQMEAAKKTLESESKNKETGQLIDPMDKARKAAQVVFADNPDAAKLLSPTPEDASDFLHARKPVTIGGPKLG